MTTIRFQGIFPAFNLETPHNQRPRQAMAVYEAAGTRAREFQKHGTPARAFHYTEANFPNEGKDTVHISLAVGKDAVPLLLVKKLEDNLKIDARLLAGKPVLAQAWDNALRTVQAAYIQLKRLAYLKSTEGFIQDPQNQLTYDALADENAIQADMPRHQICL